MAASEQMAGATTMKPDCVTGRSASPTTGAKVYRRRTHVSASVIVKVASILAVAVALASCASWPSGPRYRDHLASRTAVPPESSRLTIYRIAPEARWQGSYRSADLQIDGTSSGAISVGEFRIQDVTPGRHVLRVDITGMHGACELPLETTGGGSYFLEVAARESYWWAGQPGWALTSIPFAGLVVGPLAFAAGTAIETAGKTCGGPFSIVSVDRDAALSKLADMQSPEPPPAHPRE